MGGGLVLCIRVHGASHNMTIEFKDKPGDIHQTCPSLSDLPSSAQVTETVPPATSRMFVVLLAHSSLSTPVFDSFAPPAASFVVSTPTFGFEFAVSAVHFTSGSRSQRRLGLRLSIAPFPELSFPFPDIFCKSHLIEMTLEPPFKGYGFEVLGLGLQQHAVYLGTLSVA